MTQNAVTPIKIKTLLAPTPQAGPAYKVTVKSFDGSSVELGDPRLSRGLVALMNQHAVIGGAAAHWGGPAAFAEIMSAVHGIMFRNRSNQWFEHFNFVNDAGHAENGVYAIRANYHFDNLTFESLKGFRSIESKLTGHGENHLNPEGVLLSNGPLGSGVAQAQGLAMADKIIGNQRVTLCTVSDGACMEGEAKEAFASIPGLAIKGKLNPFVMIVSDNNTKLSGRIDQDSFSMQPTFDSLSVLGWSVVRVEDGHNLQKVYNQLEQAVEEALKNPTQPICVICKTIKGYGVKSTEESSSGGHGYPLKPYDEKLPAFIQEIFDGEAPKELIDWAESILNDKKDSKKSQSTVKKEKIQPGFSRAAIRAAKEGLPVYSLTSDLPGSTGIQMFRKEFPDLSFDFGIAEANMLSAAIGFSKQGLIPIVDTFAQFGVTKGNLPLIMSALSRAPILALFSHTGFQDAADGASHQSTTYLAATCAIPHTTAVVCSCSQEAENYMYKAITGIKEAKERGDEHDSVLFFLGRENHPPYYKEGLDYEWGKAQILSEGKDLVIVSCGSMIGKALQAKESLKNDHNLDAVVINNPFVNRPDIATIGNALKNCHGKLVTLEDHQLTGGMGSMLVHSLHLAGYQFSVESLGIQGKLGQSAYLADHLYDLHGLNNQGVLQAAKRLCSSH